MSDLTIDAAKCNECGLCVKVCPFGALEMTSGTPEFTEGCRICPICRKECPEDAIFSPGEDISQSDNRRDVLAVAELQQDSFAPVTHELIGEGQRLTSESGGDLHVAVLGHQLDGLPDELLQYGLGSVLVYDHALLEPFTPMSHTDALQDAVSHLDPAVVLMAASEIGRSLAPRLAVRLRTGLTADCTSLQMTADGELKQTRPAFGGDVMATIATHTRPQMATVRPGVMPPAEQKEPLYGAVKMRQFVPRNDCATRVKEVKPTPRGKTVADAEVVVAAGRGIRKEEDLQMLEELAEVLGGMVGCTRPLVEEGWLPNTRQVGLSGRTVRARLYIACGISGAIQHVAGMRQSDVIFAINRDENAPIFDVAHYGMVGDVYEVIPALLAAIEEGKT